MLIIEITIDEVRKVQILKLYNEKSLNDRETYTIDRLSVKYQPISTDQFVIFFIIYSLNVFNLGL